MRLVRILATLLLLVAAVPVAGARAQSPTTGQLGGAVRSQVGAPLADVRVVVRPEEGGLPVEVATDRSGRFLIPLLPAGSYQLLAERLGYHPVLVTGIPVRPDRRIDVDVPLRSAEGPVEAAERIPFSGGALTAGARAAHSRYFGSWELRDVPERDGEVLELLRLSTFADPSLAVEGLPPALSGIMVAGIPFAPAAGTGGPISPGLLLPTPVSGGAELMAGHTDVEWPTVPGGLFSVQLRPAPVGFGGEADGVWSDEALVVDDRPGEASVARGRLLVGGSLVADSATGWMFAGFQQQAEPVSLWPTRGGGLAQDLAEAGVNVSPLTSGPAPTTDRTHAAGSFDWRLGEGRAIQLFGLYGRAEGEYATGSATGAPVRAAAEGEDLLVGANAVARLTDRLDAQLRIGFGQSSRSYLAATGIETGLGDAAVLFAPTGAQLGDPAYPTSADRSDLSAQGTLYYRSGVHALKGGLGARFTQHERGRPFGVGGLYTFADADALLARRGVFTGLEGSAEASFSVAEYFVYGQDTWRVAPGLDVTTGVRYELETIPAGDILPNRRWRELTALDNTDVPETSGDLGIVAAFDWDVQEQHQWRVQGGIGVHRGDVPPDLLAELLTHDGRLEASAAVGDVSGPTPLGPRLTLLSPNFGPPLTTRASLGLSRALGRSAVLHLGAVLRETENLPRLTDLNRPEAAPFQDQYGRPVYGELVREGPLLYPLPGGNRRFGEFDAVSLYTSNGSSSYWGLTAGLEKRLGQLKGALFYTYSSTEDDVVNAAAIAPRQRLDPFGPGSELDGWIEGTSDLDVPQRLTATAELELPFAPAVRIGGLWQQSSGAPFTPGYGAAIDANADGVVGNDPAYVDSEIEGMTALMQRWDCLRQQEGRFVERNACRTRDRTLLDAWIGFRLPIGGIVPELRVEALALDAEQLGAIDAALYRLDPERTLEVDESTGEIVVPLVVNPDFGKPLVPSSELSRIRISLRMVF